MQAFTQELSSRQPTVETMKQSLTSDPSVASQLDELSNLWERVNQLAVIRQAALVDSNRLVSMLTYN